MKRHLFPAVAAGALLVALAGAASAAATDVTGTVKSTAGNVLTLTTGQSFGLMKDVDISGLKPGDLVSVSWLRIGDRTEAAAISPVGRSAVAGVVRTVGANGGTVTLQDGHTYGMAKDVTAAGLMPGDRVLLTHDVYGETGLARSLSPLGGDYTVGRVRSASNDLQTLTLDTGATFTLAEGVDVGGFRPGDMVGVIWDHVGAEHQATDVLPADGATQAG